VAMLALNSDRYLEYLVAVPWADAVLVPVNTRWSFDEIADSFDDCEVSVLLVDESFRDVAERLVARCESVRIVIDTGESADGAAPGSLHVDALIAGSEPIDDARRGGDDLAAIFYTGGTTGRSKGVMLSHANLMVSALGSAASGFWATPGGVFLHTAPMFHLADLCQWAAQSLAGSTHVIVGGFDAAKVLETVERHHVTDLFLVPTMIQMLIEHPDIHTRDLSSVRRFVYGASPIAPAVLDRTLELLPGVELGQAYGMTELSPVATLLGPAEHRAPGPHRYSAGRAAPHSEIRVVDPLDETVATGTVGEICCRGGHVMRGYWKRPEETAAAIRDGWMHTGDLGYLDDDGYLFVVDRSKDMIVSGGENVYSAEVEKVLAGHPAVAQCAVIGLPDDTYGERVHAVVVLAEGEQTDAAQLREYVAQFIARYKAPRTVSFVPAMPLSGAGKILKRTLRDQLVPESGG
jgi:acyl-CoA synthetase (AMP-forming)/AMP-acid ligase II